MKNNISPLEELRKEKAILKRECAMGEENLAAQWLYMKDNAGSLIFNSILDSLLHSLGFRSSKSDQRNTGIKAVNYGPRGWMHSVFSGVTAYYPLIWEIVQPMLLAFAAKKVKSIFSRKKKKKKRRNDDD